MLKTISVACERFHEDKGNQNYVDIVGAMIGESHSGEDRYLFFTDESGCVLSLRLAVDIVQDLPPFRSGMVCSLLNILLLDTTKLTKLYLQNGRFTPHFL